jgi:hypothetical protein
VAERAAYQVFHVERIAAEDVIRDGFSKIAQERIGVVEHAHLANADQALVGVHLNVCQIAPGGAL